MDPDPGEKQNSESGKIMLKEQELSNTDTGFTYCIFLALLCQNVLDT
jgi:hypothetical protein